MNYRFIKSLIISFAVGFFTVSTIFTIGCAPKKVKVVYEKDGNHGYSKKDHKQKHKKEDPPAHAPAHGYRAKHKYRYYPSCSVYYDSDRRIYFYLKGDSWEFGSSLPTNLRLGLGDSVSIELDTDKPYIYHSDHVDKYPPGQKKKKNKKKDKKGNKWG